MHRFVQRISFRDVKNRIIGILRRQKYLSFSALKPLDRQLSIKRGNHNLIVSGFNRPVHDKKIAVMNPRSCHRIALSPEKKRGRFVMDKVFMEIQFSVNKVISRRRKSSFYRGQVKRKPLTKSLRCCGSYDF